MKLWKVNKGVAVAPKFVTEIPGKRLSDCLPLVQQI
jgi:hypothetical protein